MMPNCFGYGMMSIQQLVNMSACFGLGGSLNLKDLFKTYRYIFGVEVGGF